MITKRGDLTVNEILLEQNMNQTNQNESGGLDSSEREFLAEILGTFILAIFALSTIAQYKFFKKDNPTEGNFISINIGTGLGVTIGIILVGKVSGAHFNPAVSFSMFLTQKMNLKRFIIYCVGQFVGAFLGALMVFIVYYDTLKSYGNQMYSLETASIFATYPNKNVSTIGCFLDQTFVTAILVMVVQATSDKNNTKLPHGIMAIIIGFTVTILGTAFAYNCGNAINPARDLAPRFLTLILGWGKQTFTAGNYFFWIPIVGPMLGASIGSLVYIIMISSHWSLNDTN